MTWLFFYITKLYIAIENWNKVQDLTSCSLPERCCASTFQAAELPKLSLMEQDGESLWGFVSLTHNLLFLFAWCQPYSVPGCVWNIKAVEMSADYFVTLHKRLHIPLSKTMNVLVSFPLIWDLLLILYIDEGLKEHIHQINSNIQSVRGCAYLFYKISSPATAVGAITWLSSW